MFQHAEFVQLMAIAPNGEIIGFEGHGNPLPPRGDIEEMVSGWRR